VLYRLDDYFLRFFFAFIHPNRDQIRRNARPLSFVSVIEGRWDNFLGLSFESLVRDHADKIADRLHLPAIQEVGTYWHSGTKRRTGVQIDVVLSCADNVTVIVECKWSRRKAGVGAVRELRHKVDLFPNPAQRTIRMVLAAANGASRQVYEQTDIDVVDLNDLIE
jgi:hypothetical protein